MFLPDVQAGADGRNIAIQRVGVRAMTHPVMIGTPRGAQPSVATVDMYVGLPADKKGTHMSRFIEVLQQHHEPLSAASLARLMDAMLERLEAARGHIELQFPYFVTKSAPVSKVRSLMNYQVTLRAVHDGSHCRITQTVVVPVTSLCPCSKKVADYGAHNQRSHVTISAEVIGDLGIEEQIRIAERAGSAEMWSLLKRPDEKYVTEQAYDNPKFVEDIVRDVAMVLDADERVVAYAVSAENFESIHNHSAYALIERDKRTA
jgi:GTP cyclohydrolase I